MHYYKRNLGDYAKKAGRLSMLQHGSYTLLLDACYDREQFPTLEEAIEWTWASTEAEIEAVKFVLSRFFTLENGRYVQKRIQEEVAEYHSKSEKNKRIAQEREAQKRDRERIVHETLEKTHESAPNHKPITINHKPRQAIKDKKAQAPECPPEVDGQVWSDFVRQRKTKLTQTALDGIFREAKAAGLTLEAAIRTSVERGWQGFKAEWIVKDRGPPGRASPSRPTIAEQRARTAEFLTGRKPTALQPEAIDAVARILD
jgi:uncharacterized protein YdaU (DUF1376 family)